MFLFAGVGIASIRVKKDTTDDYLIAGRGMHPGLAALSAVSTWNSGYMFIGAIGFTYLYGYNVIWMGIASTLGQFVAWLWLYKFIQEEGQERNVRSLSSLVAEKAGAPEAKLAAILSVLFLSIYAAAQLTSGGKALLVMMGWPALVGILIGFVLVVAYCYAGGIRASIWTDAVQSCVMIVGSIILCYIALGEVGGFSGLDSGLEDQDTNLNSFLPPDLMFGISLWIFAFFLGGLAVAGQPQVVSRVMTLGSDDDRKQAMIWFFVWQTPFIFLMLFVGLASRVLFPMSDDFDPELGLPMLAMDTMPAIGVGMILASIFAATMSTADSQVLACTAAITDDIKPEWRENHKTTKMVTLAVAAFATAISVGGLYIPGGDSVFLLVVLAVYGLGSVFVPLLIIRWMGYKPDSTHSIVMMISAFAGVIIWSMVPTILGIKAVAGADGVFPSVPGMGAAFAAHFIMNRIRTPEVSSLGRYSWPDSEKAVIFAAAILIPFAGVEAGYLLNAPTSSSSSALGGVGNYSIEGTYSFHAIAEDSTYVSDGDTVEIFANSDAANMELSGKNIVGVRAILTFTDDETQQGFGCAISQPPQPDDVSGTLTHSSLNQSSSTLSGESVTLEWHNSSIVNTNQTNISEAEIRAALDGLFGIGEHTLGITVNVNTGGGAGCQTTDDGEEISYKIDLISLEYDLTKLD